MELIPRNKFKSIEDIMLVDNIYRKWYNSLINRIVGTYWYENLPEGLDSDVMETILAEHGHLALFKSGNKFYSIAGQFYGVSPYSQYGYRFMPNYIAVIIGEKKQTESNMEIGKDCVILMANKSATPTVPLIHQYALTLADTTNSVDMSAYNTRAFNLYKATSETEYKSITDIQKALRLGKGSKVVKRTLKDIAQSDIPHNANLTPINDLIVAQTNTLRAFYRDLGFSMAKDKSQAILSDEKEMDDDMLLDIRKKGLSIRQECIDKFNEMFGTDIKVHSIFEIIEEEKEEQMEDSETSDDASMEETETESEEPEEPEEPEETTDDSDVVEELIEELEDIIEELEEEDEEEDEEEEEDNNESV